MCCFDGIVGTIQFRAVCNGIPRLRSATANISSRSYSLDTSCVAFCNASLHAVAVSRSPSSLVSTRAAICCIAAADTASHAFAPADTTRRTPNVRDMSEGCANVRAISLNKRVSGVSATGAQYLQNGVSRRCHTSRRFSQRMLRSPKITAARSCVKSHADVGRACTCVNSDQRASAMP